MLPKLEQRCPLIIEGVTTALLLNNKWFRAYKHQWLPMHYRGDTTVQVLAIDEHMCF